MTRFDQFVDSGVRVGVHDANSAIFRSSCFCDELSLQILYVRYPNALSQAIFLHQGVKLERHILSCKCGFEVEGGAGGSYSVV